MKEQKLQKGLKMLQQLLQEIKTVQAWQQVKIMEAGQQSASALRLSDNSETEIFDKCSDFWAISASLHHILESNNLKINQKRLNRIKSNLKTLECKLYYLNSDIRVY